MKKLIIFLPLFFFLFNCSDKGELEIQNHTNALIDISIDGTSYQIAANENFIKSWELSNLIFNPEEKTITISGEGLYKFRFNERRKIKPKETTSFYIIADAGAIKIENNSSKYIKSVYISPASENNWGGDALNGTIGPGEYMYWRVRPGYWDVMVIDQNNISYSSYNNHIIENHSIILFLSDESNNWQISKNIYSAKEILMKNH